MRNQWIELNRLIHDANASATWREHTLKNYWKLFVNDTRLVASNNCLRCNAWVQINTNPQPNDIDVSGEAVALNCTKEPITVY